MVWKEVEPMEEKIRFVLKATREEVSFKDLCGEFGISRKTGYKWLRRYQGSGLEGMNDVSRRPIVSPNRIAAEMEERIIGERHRHRKWGPKKLYQRLKDKGVRCVPSESTIGNVLKRNGLVCKKKRRRKVTQPDRGNKTEATRPNEVWAADYKGWFRTQDGERCDPLTISDLYSRYVLDCRIVSGQKIETTQPAFRQVFIRYGLPEVIRVDNGPPFGSRGICGFTRLSAWWVQMGIRVEFIEPGHPEQNGVHERMHRTLKEETARPPSATLSAQQRRFDRWRYEFNNERPHEALGMQKPAQRYRCSFRHYRKSSQRILYPEHYKVRMVKTFGAIKWKNKLYYVSESLHGMALGLNCVSDDRVEVYFADTLLGYLVERETGGLAPLSPAPAKDRYT